MPRTYSRYWRIASYWPGNIIAAIWKAIRSYFFCWRGAYFAAFVKRFQTRSRSRFRIYSSQRRCCT